MSAFLIATTMSTPHAPRRALAFSIVEVLISLTITSLLLTAVSAAFSASSAVIQNNDEFFRASQAARVALAQMLSEIRRANAVTAAPDTHQISLITADLQDITYRYQTGATGALKLITNDSTTDPDYTLARNVSSCSFTSDTIVGEGGVSHVARVSITLAIEVGDNLIRLSGSAAPRRAQTYN